MKILILVTLAALFSTGNLKAQTDSTRNKTVYPLYLDVPLVDLPYLRDAAKMTAIKHNNTSGFLRHLNSYESPSMEQSLALTKNLHAGNYYLNNQLWERWLPGDSPRKKVLNRIFANLTSGAVDLVFTYYGVVFSVQWLHEEFHRNGMTIRHIPSYDETYNRFNGGFANGSISRVKDEDMIRWKAEDPAGMIRSFAAGIESEFLLMRNLQKDNFYGRAAYPNVLLNLLLTKHTIDYVNQFKSPNFDNSIDSMNHYGHEIRDRDYVGWDFSAWVYDLHRPDESYNDRGIHPSGTGIDRAIKNAKLTEEERNYLSRMGKRQYLNFLSPFMLGINRIPLGRKGTYFNLAVRHYLTSFGDDITLDFMLQNKRSNLLFAFHCYGNRDKVYPGLEFGLLPYAAQTGLSDQKRLRLYPSAMLWTQPRNQRFDDQKASLGALLKLDASYRIGKTTDVYLQAETKTRGWVAGNPYLAPNTGLRAGIRTKII